MLIRPAENWSTSAASIELVWPSQLTSPLAGPVSGGAVGVGTVGVGVAVLPGSGVSVGVAVLSGNGVFVGVAVSSGRVGVAVGAGVSVGSWVLVGAGVLVGPGALSALKVAFTDWSPFIVTNVALVELSSVPVQDSQA